MKISPEQFSGDLAKGLRPIYLVTSDEPLLVDEVVDELRETARQKGLEERESYVADRSLDWGALAGSLQNLSLFSAGKLVEVRLPNGTPGDEGSRNIRALAARPADGNSIVLIAPNLDKRTGESAWVRAIQAEGAWIDARRPKLPELPRWVARRLKAAGLECDAEGIELIASRVEGNLLAARQEIDKLALLYPRGTALTAAEVRSAVADGARFDVFQLADAALAGETARAARILAGLREEGIAAPLVLWALVREIAALVDAGSRASTGMPLPKALDAAGVRPWRKDLFTSALRRQRKGSLKALLAMAGRADRLVKGARPGEPWNALLELTMAVSGADAAAGELA